MCARACVYVSACVRACMSSSNGESTRVRVRACMYVYEPMYLAIIVQKGCQDM
jgi:hypothetical protein